MNVELTTPRVPLNCNGEDVIELLAFIKNGGMVHILKGMNDICQTTGVSVVNTIGARMDDSISRVQCVTNLKTTISAMETFRKQHFSPLLLSVQNALRFNDKNEVVALCYHIMMDRYEKFRRLLSDCGKVLDDEIAAAINSYKQAIASMKAFCSYVITATIDNSRKFSSSIVTTDQYIAALQKTIDELIKYRTVIFTPLLLFVQSMAHYNEDARYADLAMTTAHESAFVRTLNKIKQSIQVMKRCLDQKMELPAIREIVSINICSESID